MWKAIATRAVIHVVIRAYTATAIIAHCGHVRSVACVRSPQRHAGSTYTRDAHFRNTCLHAYITCCATNQASTVRTSALVRHIAEEKSTTHCFQLVSTGRSAPQAPAASQREQNAQNS